MGLLGKLFSGAAKIFGRRHGSASPVGKGRETELARRQRQVDEEADYFRRERKKQEEVPLALDIDPKLERLIGKEIAVGSSWIESLKWSNKKIVDMKLLDGAHYRYNGISLELFEQWTVPATSQGKFWWANIRGKFSPAQKINGATIRRPRSKNGQAKPFARNVIRKAI